MRALSHLSHHYMHFCIHSTSFHSLTDFGRIGSKLSLSLKFKGFAVTPFGDSGRLMGPSVILILEPHSFPPHSFLQALMNLQRHVA